MVKRIILALTLLSVMLACTACMDDSSYRNTLESGRQKYATGQPMTKDEYNAVKNFNKWKSNQGTKTYNQWGN